MTQPQLICIIGAECTGKTSLARVLAERCASVWVPEYLRTFCDQQQRTPTLAEQHRIVDTQLQHEAAALASAKAQGQPYVFCDTAPLLTAIYSQFVFGDTALYGRAREAHRRYALTLLMEPDIPWEADGLQRDGPEVRPTIHRLLLQELGALKAPMVQVEGQGLAREKQALQAIHALREAQGALVNQRSQKIQALEPAEAPWVST